MEGNAGAGAIRIRSPALAAALDWARARLPGEACGLLAGRGGRIERFLPVGNGAAGAGRFFTEPASLARAHREIRESGLEWRGVFHSHPSAPAAPSAADAEGARAGPPLWVIASIPPGRPAEVRAFRRRRGSLEEIPMAGNGAR